MCDFKHKEDEQNCSSSLYFHATEAVRRKIVYFCEAVGADKLYGYIEAAIEVSGVMAIARYEQLTFQLAHSVEKEGGGLGRRLIASADRAGIYLEKLKFLANGIERFKCHFTIFGRTRVK